MSTVSAGQQRNGQVAGARDTVYGSEGWGFESLRARSFVTCSKQQLTGPLPEYPGQGQSSGVSHIEPGIASALTVPPLPPADAGRAGTGAGVRTSAVAATCAQDVFGPGVHGARPQRHRLEVGGILGGKALTWQPPLTRGGSSAAGACTAPPPDSRLPAHLANANTNNGHGRLRMNAELIADHGPREQVYPRPGRDRHEMWLLREFCDGGYAGWRITRLRRRGKPARPYIWRLIILILLTLPSMAAEL